MTHVKTVRLVLTFSVWFALNALQPASAQDRGGTGVVNQAQMSSIDDLLLFFPAKHPQGNWSPADLRHTNIWFTAQDGTRLHGWYCPCDKPRSIVLFAHGNAGNVATRVPWLVHLQSKLKVSVFAFDYRGYGCSEGAATTDGALQDARAARAKLCELAGVKDDGIILMGESLGGAIAVQLASEAAPRGLILQSTFSSLKDVADIHYPMLSWIVPAAKLDSASSMAFIRCPLLQSHGTADRVIPFSSGQKLFRAANEPKTFVALNGKDHNNWLTREYLTQLEAFIIRNATPPAGK